MPGLIRKLLIYGSINGLIVQSHGPVDHHKAIQISYDTSKITAYSGDDELQSKRDATLEAHGLIGEPSTIKTYYLLSLTWTRPNLHCLLIVLDSHHETRTGRSDLWQASICCHRRGILTIIVP